MVCRQVRRGDPHGAGPAFPVFGEHPLDVGLQAEQPHGAVGEHPAGFGQPDAAAVRLEQAQVQLGFELPDLRRDGRLLMRSRSAARVTLPVPATAQNRRRA